MSTGSSILLIEDEPGMIMTIRDRLEGEGYRLMTCENGDEGFREALSGTYDLILLDLMLPGKDGLEICRDLRSAGKQTPILMLTAKGNTLDKVLGLKLGADDYLVKPFDFLELSARMEALLRRNKREQKEEQLYRFGPYTLDTATRLLTKGRKEISLSAQEYKLLLFFLEHQNSVITREELLAGVWGYDKLPSTRTVDVHIAWLRKKLEEDGEEYIITLRKQGYKFRNGPKNPF